MCSEPICWETIPGYSRSLLIIVVTDQASYSRPYSANRIFCRAISSWHARKQLDQCHPDSFPAGHKRHKVQHRGSSDRRSRQRFRKVSNPRRYSSGGSVRFTRGGILDILRISHFIEPRGPKAASEWGNPKKWINLHESKTPTWKSSRTGIETTWSRPQDSAIMGCFR
jgi:hypothetical protein